MKQSRKQKRGRRPRGREKRRGGSRAGGGKPGADSKARQLDEDRERRCAAVMSLESRETPWKGNHPLPLGTQQSDALSTSLPACRYVPMSLAVATERDGMGDALGSNPEREAKGQDRCERAVDV